MKTIIGAGQTATGLVVSTGDLVDVNNSDGTSPYGYANGPAGGTVLQSTMNGGEIYLNYGAADQTTVNSGGQLVVGGGAIASNTVLTGGNLVLYDTTAEADHTVIEAGGVLNGEGTTHDTTVNAGGLYSLDDNYPNADHSGITVNDGGVLSIGNSYSAYSDLHLASGGSVQLPFAYGGNTAAFDASPNSLNVSYQYNSGTETGVFSLHLTGDYTTANFVLSSANGEVVVTAENVCFCKGTRIRTPEGEERVEVLRVGEPVLTADGRTRIIRWIGSAASVVNDENRPVVVRAGAFSDGSPAHDLRVTRGHSFLFRDVLIPIEYLINGASIAWDTEARTMEVFHIELDTHDILVAEGAHAESYRDDGNRERFSSSTGERRPSKSMATYAPLVTSGAIVDRTRRYLAEWAEAHGQLAAINRPRSVAAAA